MKHSISTLLVISGVLATSSASAQSTTYDFDESCAPTTNHVSEQGIPDALMVTDRSGSMDEFGGYDSGGNWQSKLSIARDVIKEVADAAHNSGPCTMSDKSGCDEVRLGLGWFSSSSGVDVLPGEDTRDTIKSTVNGYGTNGATATGEAARIIYESNELRNAERIGLGIFLTDGGPWDGGGTANRNTIERTLHYLCAARNDHSILTFMVGFGGGTNVKMNSLFAAAGGTGTCCQNDVANGVMCTYQPDELIDPCLLPRRDADQLNIEAPGAQIIYGADYNTVTPAIECKGAKQADSGQDLKDELLDLINQISCTFPLDVPNDYLRFPGADEDPAATRVEFDHTILGNDIRVQPFDPGNPNAFYDYLVTQRGVDPAIAAPYIGEGWTFADPLRRTVMLTSKLCEEVRSDNVDITETQVACLCENTGSDCSVLCEDSDGDGYDDTTDAACEDDGTGMLVQSGRCRPGIVECIIGVEYCAARFSPQPDICNGIDDDCDGNIDNSSRANPSYNNMEPGDTSGTDAFEWNGNVTQLEDWDLDEGLFCGFQDFSCGCGQDGAHEIGFELTPGNPDPDHEWKQLLHAASDFRDRCVCNPGLELEAAAFDAEIEDAESDAAGCATTNTSPVIPGSLLVFLGMFAAFFRRKRR